MPVSLGENLNIKNNKLESFGKSVYRKLNKAKAWTNTVTTSSGGTVAVIYNNDIIQTYPCDIDKFYCKTCLHSGSTTNNICIINGIMYRIINGSLVQVGNKTNWIKTGFSGISYTTSSQISVLYAIDINNDLYALERIDYQGTVQTTNLIDDTNNWTDILSSGGQGVLIGSNKLYWINTGQLTQIGTDNDWIKLSGFQYTNCAALKNGYVYDITYNSQTIPHYQPQLLSSNNNFIDISCGYRSSGSSTSISAIDNNNDRYIYVYDATNNQWSEYKDTTANFKFKKIIQLDNTGSSLIGNTFSISLNNELFFKVMGYRKINDYLRVPYTKIIIPDGCKDCIYSYKTVIIVGTNGKLYKLLGDDEQFKTYTITELDSNIGYQKIDGNAYCDTSYKGFSIAWTGDATSVSHTVYTTKSPQTGDATYLDNELTPYSTIVSVSGTTITDEYRTYDVDIAKDSSFTSIPPATIHETVGTIELLNALNPNT